MQIILTHFDVVIKRELSGRKTVLIIVLDQTLCLKYKDQMRPQLCYQPELIFKYTLNKLIKIILIFIVLYFN